MTKEEAIEFVHKTLATGNKDRIQLVLKRYYAFLKTAKPEIIDPIYEEAIRIFGPDKHV